MKSPEVVFSSAKPNWPRPRYSAFVLLLFVVGCRPTEPPPLTVDMPLHLEDHLAAAVVRGSEVPGDLRESVEWRFDEPQPDWQPVVPLAPEWETVRPVRVDDALRVSLTERNRPPNASTSVGIICVALPDWNLDDWGSVEIRARTEDPIHSLRLFFNYTEDDPSPGLNVPLYTRGSTAPVVTDGTVQTYRMELSSPEMRK